MGSLNNLAFKTNKNVEINSKSKYKQEEVDPENKISKTERKETLLDKNLSILYCNARSIKNKMDELKVLVHEKNQM